MSEFKELFENSVLNDETKAALTEAWNQKVASLKSTLKEEIEDKVRSEFEIRYDKDKGNLIEAMTNMLNDSIEKYGKEMAEQAKKLKEEKVTVAKEIINTRKEYTSKLNENTKILESTITDILKSKIAEIAEEKKNLQEKMVQVAKKEARIKEAQKEKLKEDAEKLQSFVLKALSEEISRLKSDGKVYKEAKAKAEKDLREHKLKINEETADRVNKLEQFILGQLKEEIAEFKDEKDSLAKLRVKMVKESKDHLNKVRKEFITRAANLLEARAEAAISNQLESLKEDIRKARENTFGRKIFETFAQEFMGSYLAEGTKIKAVEKQLAESKKLLESANEQLKKEKKLYENANIRLQLAEERNIRAKEMNKLLDTLNKSKRDTMKSLLESVKTCDLEKSFHKYLNILNEDVKPSSKTMLTEKANSKPIARVISGDKKKLNESLITKTETNAAIEEEINELRRRAGIKI